MQAIAAVVNRVFRDKPGGLVVDYLASPISSAGPGHYTESGGRRTATFAPPARHRRDARKHGIALGSPARV